MFTAFRFVEVEWARVLQLPGHALRVLATRVRVGAAVRLGAAVLTVLCIVLVWTTVPRRERDHGAHSTWGLAVVCVLLGLHALVEVLHTCRCTFTHHRVRCM